MRFMVIRTPRVGAAGRAAIPTHRIAKLISSSKLAEGDSATDRWAGHNYNFALGRS